MRLIITFVLGIALATACASTRQLPPGVVVGEEIAPQTALAFADVNADPTAHYEQILLVEATVTAVCQSAGCWMKIEDQGATAMVRWEDGCNGKFAFPDDVAGKRVLIQGSFYAKTISEADAEHLQEEAGGEVTFERETYEFNASAILVLDS
jgi:hypothetical protein